MSLFKIIDVPGIETTPAAAGEREAKILAMIASSTITNARVQSLDLDTRGYQVVLEGILQSEVEPSVSRMDSQEFATSAHEDDDSVAASDVSPMDDPEDDDGVVPNFAVAEPAVETVASDRSATSSVEPRPFHI